MSGFGGIVSLGGAAVEPRRLQRMAARLAARGTDAAGSWSAGRAGLVHQALWTTPEARGERQPCTLPGVPLRAVMDARVDNRAELLGRLGESAGAGDARLILRAWQLWGARAFEHVVGDFAIALCEGAGERLVLVRDALGLKSLYYAVDDAAVVFANTIGGVLAGLDHEPPLDDDLVERFLHGRFEPWSCRTIYRGVHRLPPGHLMTIGARPSAPRLYHRMGSTFQPGPGTDDEWVEGFGRLFERVVADHLRAPGPVGILTGGGLDSAAIACTAARIARASGGDVRLYGLGFERATAADERRYFHETAAYCAGAPHRLIPGDDLWAMRRWDEEYPADEPEVYLLRSHTQALFEAAAADGCRVVLAGEGGNQVIGEVYSVVELLAGLAPRQLLAELRHCRGRRRRPVRLAQAAAHRMLSRRASERLRERRRRPRPWVRGAAVRREPACQLEPEYYGSARLPRQGRVIARLLRRPYDLARLAAVEVSAAVAGVEWRLPFMDRRVVDYLLHVPWRLRAFRGRDRVILREAMRGRMPDRLRLRTDQSHFQELVERGWRVERSAIERLLDNPLSVELGFCSHDSLARAADRLFRGVAGSELGTFVCLEAWLRRWSRRQRRREGGTG